MKKLVIIINGSGGVGKDTLCDIAGRKYNTMNISSIDPIKKIAMENGWHGEKDAKSRKFLADLKQLFVEYNNLPLRYLQDKCNEFLVSDKEILFVHIREPKEISKFKNSISIACITLLVRGRKEVQAVWANNADDNVEDYQYDFYYNNIGELENLENDFLSFFSQVLVLCEFG